jgi:hypothetical protein
MDLNKISIRPIVLTVLGFAGFTIAYWLLGFAIHYLIIPYFIAGWAWIIFSVIKNRKRLKKAALLILILLLAGCATQTKYERQLGAMVGQSSSELFSSWGNPSSSFMTPEGDTVYVYESRSAMAIPVQIWPNGQVNPLSGQQVEHGCKTFFVVNQNKMITTSYCEGNYCVSR